MACKEHPANTLWPFRAFTLTKMNILMAFIDDVNYWLLDEIFITFSTQKGQIQRRRDFSKFYGKVYRRHISMIPIWSHLKKKYICSKRISIFTHFSHEKIPPKFSFHIKKSVLKITIFPTRIVMGLVNLSASWQLFITQKDFSSTTTTRSVSRRLSFVYIFEATWPEMS